MNPTPPQHPDDLDRLFSAYLKRQLPDPFPACPSVGLAEPASLARSRQSRSAARSRLALAASVALLLGLGWSVSSDPRPAPSAKAPPAAGPDLLQRATASGEELLRHTQPPETDRPAGER